MTVGLTLQALGLLGVLGLTGCGGTDGSVSVNGTSANAVRNAPAGVSVQLFMDLEGIRPDQLQSASSAGLPGCVESSSAGKVTTFTFNQCTAADQGVLTGTITVTGPTAGTGTLVTYAEAFNLTVTTSLPNNATQIWTYTGNQLITWNGTTAKVDLASPAAPIKAVFSDSATPANDKSYSFTPDNLTEDASDPSHLTVSGGWGLVGSNEDVITCVIALGDPLVWTPAVCGFPVSGSLILTLVSVTAAPDQTTASFDSGCGNLDVGGATIALGGS